MNIFIAIPAYDGKMTTQGVDSLIRNIEILRDNGHKVTPFFLNGNCYIAKARNMCVNIFMSSDCTDLIFVDTDVSYDDDAMMKLIKYDKDIVGGVYPLKKDEIDYPTLLKFDEITNNCKDEETGLVTVSILPTGFLRIKKTVFERMIKYYNIQPAKDGVYSFFDTGAIFPNDNEWYGEDVAFCVRWLAMGGELFLDPNINFKHYGNNAWSGNYHNFLIGQSVKNLDKVADGGIEGWMSNAEIEALKILSAKVSSIVEVGCWKGRSTKVFLENCGGIVYAVDHFNGSETDISGIMSQGQDIYSIFMDNVGRYENLRVLKGDSVKIANMFNGNKVDMVFIDAGHTYEECKADIEAWLPKCTKVIAGHDYSDGYDGVKRAVNEKFGTVNVIDTIWYKEINNV